MEEHVVEEVAEEQVVETPDTTELTAEYEEARDAYVIVRDAHIALLPSGPSPAVSAALEAMLSKREKYALTYGALERAGGKPVPPPPDPRFILRDRTPKEEEETNEQQRNTPDYTERREDDVRYPEPL